MFHGAVVCLTLRSLFASDDQFLLEVDFYCFMNYHNLGVFFFFVIIVKRIERVRDYCIQN